MNGNEMNRMHNTECITTNARRKVYSNESTTRYASQRMRNAKCITTKAQRGKHRNEGSTQGKYTVNDRGSRTQHKISSQPESRSSQIDFAVRRLPLGSNIV